MCVGLSLAGHPLCEITSDFENHQRSRCWQTALYATRPLYWNSTLMHNVQGTSRNVRLFCVLPDESIKNIFLLSVSVKEKLSKLETKETRSSFFDSLHNSMIISCMIFAVSHVEEHRN